jgi:uncharacterized protein
MKITRREFSRLAACATLVPCVSGAESIIQDAVPTPSLRLEEFDYSGVRLLDGPLSRQFQATRDTYYGIPNDSLLFGFRQRAGLPAPGKSLDGWYGNDTFSIFGQVLSGMARMSKATNDQPLREKALFLMTEWGKTMEPDGYFFYSKHPNVFHYTYEKTVGGLNDMYEYAGEKDALVYLDKITGWAIKNLARGQTKPDGGEWYTLSENLYRAYLNTGDKKYRDFAQVWHYTKYWNDYAEDHPDVAGLHAYSHVNTLSSAAMAYRVTGDPLYLRTITNGYDFLQRTQCYATGGYGAAEQLRAPDGSLGSALERRRDTFETPCGSWAGFKLSRYLMGFTGEALYGDWVERLVYNGIGAALPMKSSGSTFYYSDYQLFGCTKVYHEEDYHGETWPCCAGTYPEAVADYHNLIYFKNKTGLFVNLFVPSEVTWRHQDQNIVVRQETSYPEEREVTLTVLPEKDADFPLYFRVPGWATQGISVMINGQAQAVTAQAGTWAKVERSWKRGDQITLEIPLEFSLAAVDTQHPRRVAIVRGPVVWVRQSQAPFSTSFSQWKMESTKPLAFELDAAGKSQIVPFYRLGRHDPYWMYFDLES